ncbi:hypothetical protein IGB42_04149 [Andreprevotia sp. IGB-42]|uniref:hypothetical protein n=1 Tax=Andreprevotia sp. IGB-42 TaxID=2497473 RepID=UPI0013588446|nr:hypothetical protein [Andreprevotia sp. IGB-42]KAF0811383.1 hypothetical protein IGB42_04149 [Andreprevotia sp. IGB-42]
MSLFRPVLIGTMLISMFLNGCAQPDGKPLVAFLKNSQPLSGQWYGRATCSDGATTPITLTINGTAGGRLSGNLAQKTGNAAASSYSFNGQFEQDATLRIVPAQRQSGNGPLWSLTGKANDANAPSSIRGSVAECAGTFELSRNAPVAQTATTKQTSSTAENATTAEGRGLIGVKVAYDDLEQLLRKNGFKPKSGKKYFYLTPVHDDKSNWEIYQAWKNDQLFLVVRNNSGVITDVKSFPNAYGVNFVANNGSDSGDGGTFCAIGKANRNTQFNRAIFSALKPKWTTKKCDAAKCASWSPQQTQSGVWEIDRQGKVADLTSVEVSCINFASTEY